MQFDSINAFLDMGGYGFYVWLSFGFGALCILGLVIQSHTQNKAAKSDVLKRMVREEKLKRAEQLNN